ncbi:GNAT family N-acetyltransferase [Cycloclasticus pugetii]|uniref:GNAT family N-acetyltransferase n=1 Tax=Cycloclasticus pugetii TaxID=34068 RepID=UPI003A8CC6B1
MSILIKTGSWSDLEPYCRTVRLSVFVEEQGIPQQLELDKQDNHFLHVVIFNGNNTPIATARLADNGQFGRMAVLKSYRTQGLGNQLLKQITKQARLQGLQQLTCHAQQSAVGFYKKNGFHITGKPFQEAWFTHIKMLKNLT